MEEEPEEELDGETDNTGGRHPSKSRSSSAVVVGLPPGPGGGAAAESGTHSGSQEDRGHSEPTSSAHGRGLGLRSCRWRRA